MGPLLSHREPRGYALMLALLLTATVLGGSALLLQQTVSERAALKAEQREATAKSVLNHARTLAERLVFKGGVLFDAGGNAISRGFTTELGEFELNLQGKAGTDEDHRTVRVTAAKGGFSRTADHGFRRVRGLGVAVAGEVPAGPSVEIAGGVGAGRPAVFARLLAGVKGNACLLPVNEQRVVELPPAACRSGLAVLDAREGPLLLRPRTGMKTQHAPLMIAINRASRVTVEGKLALQGVLLRIMGASGGVPALLQVGPESELSIVGGLILDGPDGTARVELAEGARLKIHSDPSVVDALLFHEEGWTPVLADTAWQNTAQ
jgi:hypothetical protein